MENFTPSAGGRFGRILLAFMLALASVSLEGKGNVVPATAPASNSENALALRPTFSRSSPWVVGSSEWVRKTLNLISGNLLRRHMNAEPWRRIAMTFVEKYPPMDFALLIHQDPEIKAQAVSRVEERKILLDDWIWGSAHGILTHVELPQLYRWQIQIRKAIEDFPERHDVNEVLRELDHQIAVHMWPLLKLDSLPHNGLGVGIVDAEVVHPEGSEEIYLTARLDSIQTAFLNFPAFILSKNAQWVRIRIDSPMTPTGVTKAVYVKLAYFHQRILDDMMTHIRSPNWIFQIRNVADISEKDIRLAVSDKVKILVDEYFYHGIAQINDQLKIDHQNFQFSESFLPNDRPLAMKLLGPLQIALEQVVMEHQRKVLSWRQVVRGYLDNWWPPIVRNALMALLLSVALANHSLHAIPMEDNFLRRAA